MEGEKLTQLESYLTVSRNQNQILFDVSNQLETIISKLDRMQLINEEPVKSDDQKISKGLVFEFKQEADLREFLIKKMQTNLNILAKIV